MPILRSIQYVTFKYGDFKRLQELPFVSPLYLLTLLKEDTSSSVDGLRPRVKRCIYGRQNEIFVVRIFDILILSGDIELQK